MVDYSTDSESQSCRLVGWDAVLPPSREHEFADASGVDVYFCEPASPWQRPTNENTNGLLREYFPKGRDLSLYSTEEVAFAAAELSHRPRKNLFWRIPRSEDGSLPC